MCLIAFAYGVHPQHHLLVLANRDEFRQRPTAALHRWEDPPQILAGRDLQAGGTWLGVSETGRFAAITNYREPGPGRPGPSRGALVGEFLAGEQSAGAYLSELAPQAENYSGYNLLLWDHSGLWYHGNRGPAPRPLVPGIYGLSNGLLDSPWPKLVRLRDGLARHLAQVKEPDPEALFSLLADPTKPPRESLPDTGVSMAWEETLSSAFIDTPEYGTRCSTLVWLNASGARVAERSWPGGEQREGEIAFH